MKPKIEYRLVRNNARCNCCDKTILLGPAIVVYTKKYKCTSVIFCPACMDLIYKIKQAGAYDVTR